MAPRVSSSCSRPIARVSSIRSRPAAKPCFASISIHRVHSVRPVIASSGGRSSMSSASPPEAAPASRRCQSSRRPVATAVQPRRSRCCSGGGRRMHSDEGGSASKKTVYAALVGNVLVAATKFTAAAVTGSASMLSEGVHSLVDTGNEVLLLYGYRQSAREPDPTHPLGYGREIYFWSFMVAVLLFAVGAGASVYEGIGHIRAPQR